MSMIKIENLTFSYPTSYDNVFENVSFQVDTDWKLDLKAGDTSPCTILNSDKAESYHCWSSNGRWVVFGSRRLDGRYTRLYFSHFDGKGQFTKPFLLPQKHPKDNILRMKSYNIPEFVKGEVSPVEKF